MDKKTATTVASLYLVAGVATVNYFRVRRIERAKREQIELNLQRDLAAIRYASARINEEIAAGGHPFPNSVSIEESFRFHKMTAPSVMK